VTELTTEVALVPSTIEAQLIVGLLESNGIAAATSADDAGGLEPQWQLTQGVRVLVAAADESRARELVSEVEAEGAAAAVAAADAEIEAEADDSP
jgi:putative signal transducing protein